MRFHVLFFWSVLGLQVVWPCMLRAGCAWFLISACCLRLCCAELMSCNTWFVHAWAFVRLLVSAWFSFTLDGWELLIGYTLFSVCDDERALHPLTCGLICLVLQLLVAFIDTGPVLLGWSLDIYPTSLVFTVPYICMDELLPPVLGC